MADDWKPGDLALCVKVTHPAWPNQASNALRVGRVYTVEKVGVFQRRFGERALGFTGLHPRKGPGHGFLESMFRKIHPHAPDAEDAETLRLLSGAPAPKVSA